METEKKKKKEKDNLAEGFDRTVVVALTSK